MLTVNADRPESDELSMLAENISNTLAAHTSQLEICVPSPALHIEAAMGVKDKEASFGFKRDGDDRGRKPR
jgi:hypothetical protein